MATINVMMDEFESSLDTDKEGDPILPNYGEGGYRFRPENIKDVYNRIEQTQQQALRALVKFKHDQSPEDSALIKPRALCDFFKGTDVEKVILTEIRAMQNPAIVPLREGNHTEQSIHEPMIPEVPVDGQGGGEDPPVLHSAEAARVLRDLPNGGFNTGSRYGSQSSGMTSVSATFLRMH